jgi:hypothetical protein
MTFQKHTIFKRCFSVMYYFSISIVLFIRGIGNFRKISQQSTSSMLNLTLGVGGCKGVNSVYRPLNIITARPMCLLLCIINRKGFPWFSRDIIFSESAESESELLYDCRFMSNQFVLATSPFRLTTSNFFFN